VSAKPSGSSGRPSRSARRAGGGRARPYLAGDLRVAFDAWLDAAVERHSRELEFREIRKGVQALSALYVQRRAGADLAARAIEGRGKRAAIATCFAPLHFLTVHHVLAGRGPAPFGAVRRVLDLGCGTGAAGAATAATLTAAGATPPAVLAIDRSGFVLGEARTTYAAFGLLARTVRGALPAALPAALPEAGEGDLLVLGWAVNELDERARAGLLAGLRRALAAGARLLLLEPLAGPASPWWREWADALAPLGIEEPRDKVQVALPEWIARLDRAAGLDHRVLGARVLLGPLAAPAS
jgi:SAM-dependent methyltransferase